MKVSVIGLGYVGAVSSVCMAKQGNRVYGVDLDTTKVELLRQGSSPVIEENINELTAEAIASGNLTVSSQLDATTVDVDIVFVCVGTPSAPNGSQDLTAIVRVCKEIGSLLKKTGATPSIIIRSTIPAGTTEGLVRKTLEEFSGLYAHEDFGLGFQPEFLREGSSVKDFYNPPFTIVGGDQLVIEKTKFLFSDLPGDFIATDIPSAEMLKVACNAFHALKVTFANEIGRLSQSVGLDSRSVMSLLCLDQQLNISPAYLRPGFAFGGSCLPKDLRALLYMAKANDVELPMLNGILPSNTHHIQHVSNMIYRQKQRKIGFVGLSFKQGTDDLRESPLVTLAEQLIGKGYELKIYDVAVNVAMLKGSNKTFIQESIPHFESLVSANLSEVLDFADIVIVGHKSHLIEAEIAARVDNFSRVIDLVGLETELPEGLYSGVCW